MYQYENVKRGQIYFITDISGRTPTGGEMWSDRPGIVVSNDVNNSHNSVVQVVYLTSSARKRYMPTHVPLVCEGKRAIALCEQIHAVDKSRLSELMGEVTPQVMQEIEAALLINLNLTCSDGHMQTAFRKWENYINHYRLDDMQESSSPNIAPDVQLLKQLSRDYRSIWAMCETGSRKVSQLLQDAGFGL